MGLRLEEAAVQLQKPLQLIVQWLPPKSSIRGVTAVSLARWCPTGILPGFRGWRWWY